MAFRGRPNSCALERSKVKQLVLLNRTTNTAAELVALQVVVRWSEEVSGIQRTVSEKLKGAAVNVIRPGFGSDVDDTAGGIAILGT